MLSDKEFYYIFGNNKSCHYTAITKSNALFANFFSSCYRFFKNCFSNFQTKKLLKKHKLYYEKSDYIERVSPKKFKVKKDKKTSQ